MEPGSERRLEVRVIPRSKRNEVGGERAGRLMVRTTAAPVDGKANKSVLKLLAKHLNVRISALRIVSGHHCRDKVIVVDSDTHRI